jgi:hypothetical protein
MATGPVQLVVLGFNHPDFHGEIITDHERLRDRDTVRVIDALAICADWAGAASPTMGEVAAGAFAHA